jgi:hypothetical protein
MTDRMPRVDIPLAIAPGAAARAPARAGAASGRPPPAGPGDGGGFRAVLTAARAGPPRRAAASASGQQTAGTSAGRGKSARARGISPADEGPADDRAAERGVALLAPWQINEGPPRAPPPRPLAAGLPPAAIERLLLGSGARGAEARLRIGHGPLAGTEIHLRHLPGGVEAVVLTRVESSRQTLAVAMEEVARRLQRKGYAFRLTSSPDGGRGDDPGPGAHWAEAAADSGRGGR